MIIDPHIDGCTIWHGDNIQSIKGNVVECCDRIIKFITISDDFGRYQCCDVLLDAKGIGMNYADYFRKNGIRFTEVYFKEMV